MKIAPVILSGGAGTRLWPLSRNARPKQFLKLVGEHSLIQSAALRAPANEGFDAPVVVAGEAHLPLIEAQMAEISIAPHAIVIEPAGRNTAPAIALAAHELDPDTLMLVMPSDQVIANVAAFRAAVAAAAPLAAEGWLLTFGVQPDRPETGYGYIEAAAPLAEGVRQVVRFVEKPDAATAAGYVASGRFFWNAGIFLIRAGTYLEALARHAPGIATAAARAHETARRDGVAVRPGQDHFLASPSDSIDYAIMEKADRVAVAPVDMGWSDIGAFAALWSQLPHDDMGNAVMGEALVHESRNCLVASDGPVVALVGVEGLSVVVDNGVVMVVANDRAQDVKHVVDQLKRRGRDDIC